MRYGFIGAGNLGGAMIEGMARSKIIDPANIAVFDKLTQERVINDFSVLGAKSYEDLVLKSDIIFVAVKPNDCPPVFSGISPYLKESNCIVVSTAAGISLAQIQDMLGWPVPAARIMPNLNARFNKSATAVCAGTTVNKASLDALLECLKSIGEVFCIEEKHFSVFTAIASCSPAFTYMYIDALARAALKFGLNKQLAQQIAACSVSGSAEYLSNSPFHPYELIDMVCSPGGVTLEGINELMEGGFEPLIIRAITACVAKDKQLKSII